MAGEMVWIKQLLAKYEDQSLAFENPHKCQVGWQSAYDFSLRQRQCSWASWLARPATSQLWAWLRALAAVNKVEEWLALIPPSGSTCMHTYLINQETGKGKLQWLSNQHILLPTYVRVHMCNAYVCGCQRTALGVINSGHILWDMFYWKR